MEKERIIPWPSQNHQSWSWRKKELWIWEKMNHRFPSHHPLSSSSCTPCMNFASLNSSSLQCSSPSSVSLWTLEQWNPHFFCTVTSESKGPLVTVHLHSSINTAASCTVLHYYIKDYNKEGSFSHINLQTFPNFILKPKPVIFLNCPLYVVTEGVVSWSPWSWSLWKAWLDQPPMRPFHAQPWRWGQISLTETPDDVDEILRLVPEHLCCNN